jgi:hypothetical protein
MEEICEEGNEHFLNTVLEISWLTEKALNSHEGLCFMELGGEKT